MTTAIRQPKMVGSCAGGEKRKRHKACARAASRHRALEQAYVQDVYSLIASSGEVTSTSPVHSQVKQFIVEEFEPGSILLDIGCADGQYLNLSPDVVIVGLERCGEWFDSEPYKGTKEGQHLVVGDVMCLPFRDELFDGVLCCSVLHHLSTLERRINALKEIARIMKVGGKVMLTVTSGPSDVKDLESQDVLIRVDRSDKQFSSTLNNFSGSDFDSKSYSSSAGSSNSSSTNSSLELNVYENCASSPTSSEFENCYSFVKKALKRFSLTSSIYSMKNSFSDGSSKSKFSANLSLHDEMYPIELRNLDEDSSSQCSSHSSSSTTGDSALSSFNRSSSGCISQTSSNNIFPSSLLSLIKEHLHSWKVQFTSSIAWSSLDPKTAQLSETGKGNSFEGADSATGHRFSLPVSLRNGPKTDSSRSVTARSSKNKHKVYASNGINKPLLHNFAIDGVVKQVELNLSHVILPKKKGEEPNKGDQHMEPIAIATVTQSERTDGSLTVNSRIIFQKSFSSESSRQASFECSGYKLIAYYSMPELRTISARPECDASSCTIAQQISPCSSRLHSLETVANFDPLRTCCRQDTPSSLQSESKECLLAEMELKSDCDSAELAVPLSVSPASALSDVSKDSEMESAIADEMKENPSTLHQANSGKFPKKLLRQRSFSADYQPEGVKFQPELPRRFSASPNIGTHRYNSNSHTPHHQQISIDSEESFVTIIPAIRSTRDSMVDMATANDFDLEEEEYDLASNQDLSPNEIELYDSSDDDDDDAYCESLSNEQLSEDNTSVSSVLEATIRSVSKSDSKDSNCIEELPAELSPGEDEEEEAPSEQPPNSTVQSPPTTLHRYFHLYRSGELESLIEEHVQNLHIIDSFYNEYATSWCIVAERVHVWTI